MTNALSDAQACIIDSRALRSVHAMGHTVRVPS